MRHAWVKPLLSRFTATVSFYDSTMAFRKTLVFFHRDWINATIKHWTTLNCDKIQVYNWFSSKWNTVFVNSSFSLIPFGWSNQH